MNTITTLLLALWTAFLSLVGLPASTPLPLIPEKPTQFIVVGDSGTGSDVAKDLVKVMGNYPIDLLLHTGDLAYYSGSEEELQQNFFSVYKPILDKAPAYPAPGNHEYLTDNLQPYLNHFKDRYHSFDMGPIHFISLDTNTSLYGDEMTEWLEQDLQTADRKNKWTIAYFHHPPFSSGEKYGDNLTVKRKIVPILEKYNVDLVFSGHEHAYERMKPINGVTYIVTGGGSEILYAFGEPHKYSAVRETQTHFVYVSATRCELTGIAINLKNEVIDTFTLDRCMK